MTAKLQKPLFFKLLAQPHPKSEFSITLSKLSSCFGINATNISKQTSLLISFPSNLYYKCILLGMHSLWFGNSFMKLFCIQNHITTFQVLFLIKSACPPLCFYMLIQVCFKVDESLKHLSDSFDLSYI